MQQARSAAQLDPLHTEFACHDVAREGYIAIV
jgi:hypothetical protein